MSSDSAAAGRPPAWVLDELRYRLAMPELAPAPSRGLAGGATTQVPDLSSHEPPPVPTALVEKTCKTCVHCRAGVSITQLLVNNLDATARGQAIDKRKELNQREAQVVESAVLASADDGTQTAWDRPPRQNMFCGVAESQGEWLIAQAKNRTNRDCVDHRAEAAQQARSCATCRFNVMPGVGDALTAVSTALRSAGKDGTRILTEYVHTGLKGLVETELEEAFTQVGANYTKPAYLPVCAKLSDTRTYVIAPLRNTAEKCAVYERGQPQRQSYPPLLQAWQYAVDAARQLEATGMRFGSEASRARYNLALRAVVEQGLIALGFEPGGAQQIGDLALHAIEAYADPSILTKQLPMQWRM